MSRLKSTLHGQNETVLRAQKYREKIQIIETFTIEPFNGKNSILYTKQITNIIVYNNTEPFFEYH